MYKNKKFLLIKKLNYYSINKKKLNKIKIIIFLRTLPSLIRKEYKNI